MATCRFVDWSGAVCNARVILLDHNRLVDRIFCVNLVERDYTLNMKRAITIQ